MGNGSDIATVLLGLDGFRLIDALDHEGELWLSVETVADRAWCRTCGARAGAKGRVRTWVRDVPAGGRPVVVVVWRKRGAASRRPVRRGRGVRSPSRSGRGPC